MDATAGIVMQWVGPAWVSLMFAMVFAVPVRKVFGRMRCRLSYIGAVAAIAPAIFAQYWVGRTGTVIVFSNAAAFSVSPPVLATEVVVVTTLTFAAGAWVLGWALAYPSEVRLQRGAVANATVLVSNAVLVGTISVLDSLLGG